MQKKDADIFELSAVQPERTEKNGCCPLFNTKHRKPITTRTHCGAPDQLVLQLVGGALELKTGNNMVVSWWQTSSH